MTANSDIPFAKSFVDYIVRWMGMQFIAGYRAANAPKREGFGESPAPVAPVGDPEPAPAESILSHRENLRDAVAGQDKSPSNGGHGNGGNGGRGSHDAASATLVAGRKDLLHETVPTGALNTAMSRLMGDAPTCTCGSITVRNGSCYKCLNCGASLGCS